MSATAEVFSLFERHGTSGYDEAVTMTEHCVQTAALSQAAGAANELIAAALLHDVGHLLLAERRGHENFLEHDWDHETVGATWIRSRFGDAVATPVQHHVAAKRCLCAVDAEYFDLLSPASVASLEVQGGIFSSEEAAAFMDLPGAEAGMQLRRWDDDGKVAGLSIPPLEHYRPLLAELEVR